MAGETAREGTIQPGVLKVVPSGAAAGWVPPCSLLDGEGTIGQAGAQSFVVTLALGGS